MENNDLIEGKMLVGKTIEDVVSVEVKRCKLTPIVNEDDTTYSKMEGFYEGVFNDCMDSYLENLYNNEDKNKSLMDYKA